MKITKVDAIPSTVRGGGKKAGAARQAAADMEVGEVLEFAFDEERECESVRNAVYNLKYRTARKFRTAVDGNRLYVQRLQ